MTYCALCDGTGLFDGEKCPDCLGSGAEPECPHCGDTGWIDLATPADPGGFPCPCGILPREVPR